MLVINETDNEILFVLISLPVVDTERSKWI